ncbi:MAG: ankyrin repeat domain-containing protein [bacterium]|nr:ankyrin repeat domain-containing protein [bacterium]
MKKGARRQFALSLFLSVITPGLLLAPRATASEPEGSRLLGRLVQVHDVWCEYDTQLGNATGITVNAVVRANGLLGETMVGALRLRDHGGRPVQAIFGAPASFAAANGIFQAISTDPMRFESAEWNPFRLFVPYNLLALPAGQQHRLIVTFEASCRGLASIAETDIAIPPDERGETGTPRELRIASLVESPHLLLVPRPPAYPPPDVGGMGPEGLGPRPVPLSADLSGLMLTGQVKAEGLQGETVSAELRLRRADGEPVKTVKGAPAEYTDKDGRFVSRVTEKVPDGTAELPPLNLWIPFSALDLPRGEAHTLVVSFRAAAGGLNAMWEQDFLLLAPAPAEKKIEQPPVEPPPLEPPEGTVPEDQRERIEGSEELVEAAKPGDVQILLSAAKGQKDAVQRLLDSGANVFATDALGRTPLHLAAQNGHREVANMLISAASSPPLPEPDETPSSQEPAKKTGGLFDFADEYLESLSFDKFVERTSAYLNLGDHGGQTALHLAAAKGRYDVVDLLVGFGANVNAAGNDGRTPLHVAAAAGDDAVVALLLLKGANAATRDKEGKTPLDLATTDAVRKRLRGTAPPRGDME